MEALTKMKISSCPRCNSYCTYEQDEHGNESYTCMICGYKIIYHVFKEEPERIQGFCVLFLEMENKTLSFWCEKKEDMERIVRLSKDLPIGEPKRVYYRFFENNSIYEIWKK